MESSGSYFELVALDTPRGRAATEGSLFVKKAHPPAVRLVDAATQTEPQNEHTAAGLIREKALSICLHVSLIATFETLFFFQFVSGLADKGIVNMVDKYSALTFGGCRNLSTPARTLIVDLIEDLAANTTTAAIKAVDGREQTNGALLRGSWIFTGAMYIAWLLAATVSRRHKVPWRLIIVENVVMIGILAAYEAVFVNVVVLNYDSITMPELDQLVIGNALEACV